MGNMDNLREGEENWLNPDKYIEDCEKRIVEKQNEFVKCRICGASARKEYCIKYEGHWICDICAEDLRTMWDRKNEGRR